MVSLKRTIAGLIVCFKPHVLLTLCIFLVIAHSIIMAIQKGAGNSWRSGGQQDFTLAMTTLILIVALIWAAFFVFIVRFELRNELESLLILFQCSKRGLRLLGVIGFHVVLLAIVSFIVSIAVERSIPSINTHKYASKNATLPENQASIYHLDAHIGDDERMVDLHQSSRGSPIYSRDEVETSSNNLKGSTVIKFTRDRGEPFSSNRYNGMSTIDRDYLLTVYKIWLTAIVYAFLYLIMENVVMFYTDMSLIEFVHLNFLSIVAKLTGIDLSDYPAGEMLFNPLVRHRIR